MKRFSALFASTLVLALSAAALAGEHGKCTASAQACLNKMSENYAQSGWAGLEGKYDEEHGTYTVASIAEDSPAQAAGLRVDDVLFGINGQKFAEMDEAAWAATKGARIPGATVTYMVKRDGKKVKVDVVLAEMPEDVIASKVGKHMLDHVTVAAVQ